MIKEAIIKLSHHADLTEQEAAAVMDEIMNGEASDVQKAAYLTALAMKGESIEEITGSALTMRAHAVPFPYEGESLEIVGTGGDESLSFNISTTSAFVLAAADIPVTKHGNRGGTSLSGAADVLEALGADITISPEKSAEILRKVGFCFLFAQSYHPAMKYVGPIRKELGTRTVFNILGPLTNPAHARMQLMGVYDEQLVRPLARVLSNLGVRRGMVVYGMDRLDEISLGDMTTACEFNNGEFTDITLTPEQFGISRQGKDVLKGGTPAVNAEITRNILSGRLKDGKRDAVLMNAGTALYLAGKASTPEGGATVAGNLIDNGRAYERMEEYIKLSKK